MAKQHRTSAPASTASPTAAEARLRALLDETRKAIDELRTATREAHGAKKDLENFVTVIENSNRKYLQEADAAVKEAYRVVLNGIVEDLHSRMNKHGEDIVAAFSELGNRITALYAEQFDIWEGGELIITPRDRVVFRKIVGRILLEMGGERVRNIEGYPDRVNDMIISEIKELMEALLSK